MFQITDRKGAAALVAHLKCDVQELIREVDTCRALCPLECVEESLHPNPAGLSADVGVVQTGGFVQKFSDCIFSFKREWMKFSSTATR